MENKKDDKDVGLYLLILIIIIILLLLMTRGLYQFNYDLSFPQLDTMFNNVLSWDLDYKWFFRSSSNPNAFLEKGFTDWNSLFKDNFNSL